MPSAHGEWYRQYVAMVNVQVNGSCGLMVQRVVGEGNDGVEGASEISQAGICKFTNVAQRPSEFESLAHE